MGATQSVCPQCLRRLPAQRVAIGDAIYLEKECPEHGSFRTVIWRGLEQYRKWESKCTAASRPPAARAVSKGCPYDCGLCEEHRQHTCCVVMEVTSRCNLRCPVCFASASPKAAANEPSLEEIRLWCRDLMRRGGPFNIQLSGGEPTLRDDLPEIVALIRQEGCNFVQLNTNGLRLASDAAYAQRLQQAGLGCVFLQYDGVTAVTHRTLRGRDLRSVKLRAIRNCGLAGLGVVLVPTIVKGLNSGEIGLLLKQAIELAPVVRAVHFQPLSYFGRYPSNIGEEGRITLPELLAAIERQSQDRFHAGDFYPASGENAFCEFHGKFTLQLGGKVTAAPRPKTACCAPPPAPLVTLGATAGGEGARRARQFVAQHWAAPQPAEPSPADLDLSSLDAFLEQQRHSFCISAMAFMDAWNLDLERLQECFLHAYSPDGKLVPLCAYNLTAATGGALYRNHDAEREGGVR